MLAEEHAAQLEAKNRVHPPPAGMAWSLGYEVVSMRRAPTRDKLVYEQHAPTVPTGPDAVAVVMTRKAASALYHHLREGHGQSYWDETLNAVYDQLGALQ